MVTLHHICVSKVSKPQMFSCFILLIYIGNFMLIYVEHNAADYGKKCQV